jgi:tetratricopeptide (TPR) repeat protein
MIHEYMESAYSSFYGKRQSMNNPRLPARKRQAWFMLLLFCQAICLESLSAFQTDAQNARANLYQGIAEYDNANFQRAAGLLEDAISGLSGKDDLIEAHKYLAFVYATLNDREKAIGEFIHVLKLDPNFELPSTESPRFLELFRLAKARMPVDTLPPVIQCDLPETITAGVSLMLTARITDDSGVDRAVVRYKRGNEVLFTALPMTRKEDGSYQAEIPKEKLTIGIIQLYLEATDSKGNGPGFWHGSEKPFQATVLSAAPTKKSKKWLYIGIGATVVGGVILGIVLTRKHEPNPIQQANNPVLRDPPVDPQ